MKKSERSAGGSGGSGLSRRRFILTSTGALAGTALSAGRWGALQGAEVAVGKRRIPDRSAQAPSSPVAVLRCASYDPKVFRGALEKTFELLGGIQPLVRDCTVTVKLNLTGL